ESRFLLGIRGRGRRAGRPHASGRADVDPHAQGRGSALALALKPQFSDTFCFEPPAFASFRRFSKSGIEIAPGTRSPSSKMIVGVPVMRLSCPNAMFWSSGVGQLLSPVGTASLVIVSIHDLPGSFEHQMALAF